MGRAARYAAQMEVVLPLTAAVPCCDSYSSMTASHAPCDTGLHSTCRRQKLHCRHHATVRMADVHHEGECGVLGLMYCTRVNGKKDNGAHTELLCAEAASPVALVKALAA